MHVIPTTTEAESGESQQVRRAVCIKENQSYFSLNLHIGAKTQSSDPALEVGSSMLDRGLNLNWSRRITSSFWSVSNCFRREKEVGSPAVDLQELIFSGEIAGRSGPGGVLGPPLPWRTKENEQCSVLTSALPGPTAWIGRAWTRSRNLHYREIAPKLKLTQQLA